MACCRAALPLLLENSGCIVNITSVAGLQGHGSSIPYAASKAAVNCLTKSLARAFAPRVRVNAVAPGPVLTRWLHGHEDMVEQFVKGAPLQRAATPDGSKKSPNWNSNNRGDNGPNSPDDPRRWDGRLDFVRFRRAFVTLP